MPEWSGSLPSAWLFKIASDRLQAAAVPPHEAVAFKAAHEPVEASRIDTEFFAGLSRRPLLSTEDGRKARPTCSGLYPSTRCRYSAPRKNIENIPTTSSAMTRLAPVTVRTRNNRSGISEFAMRAWRTTKALTSTTEAASSPRVRKAIQPASVTPMMA